MSNAWIFQDTRMVEKHGAEAASWYVGWYTPDKERRSKSCGPGEGGKRKADKLRRKIDAEIYCGQYREHQHKTWADFRAAYDEKIAGGLDDGTRRITLDAMKHFERLVKPVRILNLGTESIDTYVALRREERGKKRGSTISPATVNKELRHLRAVIKIAHDWGYVDKLPRYRFLREPGKLPTYVIPDHFAAIYQHCDSAKAPADQPYTPGDWWRGLIVMGYMTGWRIGDLLGLKRDDVDLDAGTAITRFEVAKGKRDDRAPLHPVIVEHLRKLAAFTPLIFYWPHDMTHLYQQFARIQRAAGISLSCRDEHEHTPACHVYGFHDLRRAFATMNADKLTADALQALMRHKSYQTTQKYINLARQMDQAVANLHVPEVLRNRKGEGQSNA